MLYFKTGKFTAKAFPDLCPKSKVYLEAGDYTLNPATNILHGLMDNQDDINVCKYNMLALYIALNVDFDENEYIPIKIDRKGYIYRTDVNEFAEKCHISTLFK